MSKGQPLRKDFAQLGKEKQATKIQNFNYSACIPTIGREETIPAVLLSLAFQSQLPYEVIVLDESRKPLGENFFFNQALDVLSLKGVKVKIIRNRRKEGIGTARWKLCLEATSKHVLMVDDDVVLEVDCARDLLVALNKHQTSWAVPTCILVPNNFVLDGYRDEPVDILDPSVQMWTKKYPWFIPYFDYTEPVECLIPCAGTQSILVDKEDFQVHCEDIQAFGRLPREDTYMTTKMGQGIFASSARCLHFEHHTQLDRANWGDSMFYRLHEACMEDPDGFVRMLGRK